MTSSKQWIHFLRSERWPPTSNNLLNEIIWSISKNKYQYLVSIFTKEFDYILKKCCLQKNVVFLYQEKLFKMTFAKVSYLTFIWHHSVAKFENLLCIRVDLRSVFTYHEWKNRYTNQVFDLNPNLKKNVVIVLHT